MCSIILFSVELQELASSAWSREPTTPAFLYCSGFLLTLFHLCVLLVALDVSGNGILLLTC